MSNYAPTNHDMWAQGILLFHVKKTALESHWMLLKGFGTHALGCTEWNEWWNKIKSAEPDVRNEELWRPSKKFEYDKLQALLDDDGRTQEQLLERLDAVHSTFARGFRAMGIF